jgi:MFS transporter, OPA family, glycerol-3-phosphate transporter
VRSRENKVLSAPSASLARYSERAVNYGFLDGWIIFAAVYSCRRTFGIGKEIWLAEELKQEPSSSGDGAIAGAFVPHSPEFRMRRGRNWFFLGLMYASYYLCRRNLPLVKPEMAKQFGFTNAQLGTIDSGRDGGYAVGQFINGLLADRIGGKQAMALGAIATVILNISFGLVAGTGITWILLAFIMIRTFDGYMQAFGSPGFVKINTSWFQRRERGRFAAIFGGMIQLGDVGVGQLTALLLGGFSITWLGIHLARQNWRIMFFVPPAITLVMVCLMWLNVKNHPEEAGFSIKHDDDEHSSDIEKKLPIGYVFKKIASNPIVWINASAYFCTGFVRNGVVLWWAKYMYDKWKVDPSSGYFKGLAWSLPLAAFVGSFSSGFLSDTIFKGRRAPIAALLYLTETLVIILTILVLGHSATAGPLSATILLTAIAVTCNSTHSILGTAAAMDLGGRKMAGFASGVIDSFQYIGSMLAGFMLGGLIDKYGWTALFHAMVPFSLMGTLLMTFVWLTTRGRDVKGT